MTLEEAKDILLKLEILVSKTNRMYKKGERMDSAPSLNCIVNVSVYSMCRKRPKSYSMMIGKHADGRFLPYYLESLHYVRFTNEKEEVPETLLTSYRYAYGVHFVPTSIRIPTWFPMEPNSSSFAFVFILSFA
jgi:hypothetical protein